MPLVTYSVLRLGLLAACFALGYWAGLRTWLLLGVAVLAAWALSYVLLAGPRDAAATYLATRLQRRGARGGADAGAQGPADDEAHEDAVVDRALADEERSPGSDAAERRYPGETARPRPNSAP